MRLVWGVLSLLVVLAAVGLTARKQIEPVRSGATADVSASGVGTPAQQSKALQQKVQDDVSKLMQQAPARGESPR
jgi:hypothetical protein